MNGQEAKTFKWWLIRSVISQLFIIIIAAVIWYATTNATIAHQGKAIEHLKLTKADKDNMILLLKQNQEAISFLNENKADKETVEAQLKGIEQKLDLLIRLQNE